MKHTSGVTALTAMFLAMTAPAPAQPDQTYPPIKWAAREMFPQNGAAVDEGVDLVHWNEVENCTPTDDHWIYSTGWVTETDPQTGAAIGTRFATFRYDATWTGPNPPTIGSVSAYYPALGTGLGQGNAYKAVAMALDTSNGDIYIVGQGPRGPTDNNLDFHIVKYDKDLNEQWHAQYDGTAGGDDIPVDVATNAAACAQATYVIIAGTSPGLVDKALTGDDIVCLALRAVDGEPADAASAGEWAVGPGQPEPGVRRCDNPVEHADDRAAELGAVFLTSTTNSALSPGLGATVLGTTWDGPEFNDIVFLTWSGPDPTTPDNSAAEYHFFRNDVGVGIATSGDFHYATGHSETQDPPTSFGGGGSGFDIDFTTLRFTPGLTSADWAVHHDFMGDDDLPTDIDLTEHNGIVHLWQTGWAFNPTTIKSEFATLLYTYDFTSPTLEWDAHLPLGGDVVYGLRCDGVADTSVYGTGRWANSTRDSIFSLKYANPPVNGLPSWYRSYSAGGFDEGRCIVAVPVDQGSSVRSIFVVGTSTASATGRDFVTLKYKK